MLHKASTVEAILGPHIWVKCCPVLQYGRQIIALSRGQLDINRTEALLQHMQKEIKGQRTLRS